MDEILDSAIAYSNLRAFYEEVLLGDNVLRLAFSFRAYAAVLKDFCFTVLQKVVHEEKIVREQSGYFIQEKKKRKKIRPVDVLYGFAWKFIFISLQFRRSNIYVVNVI